MATPLTFFYSKTPGVDYLYRPVPSGFNQTKWTFSTWIKFPSGFSYGYGTIFSILCGTTTDGYPDNEVTLSFGSTNGYFVLYRGATYSYFIVPSGLQTDTLYCLQFDYDSANATDDDRIRVYLDGQRLVGYEALPGYWYPPDQFTDTYTGFTSPTYVISGYLLGVDAGNGVGEYSPEKLRQGRTFLVSGSNPTAADIYAGDIPSSYGSAGFLLSYETAQTIADDSSGNNNDFTLAGDEDDSWFPLPYRDLSAEWDVISETVVRELIAEWSVSTPSSANVAFVDESLFTHIWGAVETASFSDVVEAFLESTHGIVDSLVFADVIRNAYPISVTNTVTLTTDSVRTIRLAMAIVTTLRMLNPTGSAAQQTTFMHSVATSLVLRSLVGTARLFEELTDVTELADTVSAVIRAVDIALSELVVEADSVLYFRILTNAESIVALVDELSQSTAVYNEVGDTILFVGAIGLDNEDYTVWAVHPSYPAATEYDNFEFNSFAKAGGKYLAASRDGIYELGGSSDAGADIAAVVRTGLFDFGATQLKQVTRAYLGYTSDNRLVLKTIATDGGQKIERWYELQDKTADDIRESRIKLGKGVKSRYWQFELINVDGGQFEIDQLHLMPLMLSRRVKE